MKSLEPKLLVLPALAVGLAASVYLYRASVVTPAATPVTQAQAPGAEPKATPAAPGARSAAVAAPAAKVSSAPDAKAPQAIWPEHAPLTQEEQEQFAVVETQVVRFYDWGSIDPERLDAFRTALFALQSRGIAHHARQLLEASKETVKTPEEAKNTIEKADLLRYFAENGNALAQEAIRKLVTRGFTTDGRGMPVDRVKAQLTLESYEILAKVAPEEARVAIKLAPPDQVVAYAYHFVLGRRLAGDKTDDTLASLAEHFGPELVDYLKASNLI